MLQFQPHRCQSDFYTLSAQLIAKPQQRDFNGLHQAINHHLLALATRKEERECKAGTKHRPRAGPSTCRNWFIQRFDSRCSIQITLTELHRTLNASCVFSTQPTPSGHFCHRAQTKHCLILIKEVTFARQVQYKKSKSKHMLSCSWEHWTQQRSCLGLQHF